MAPVRVKVLTRLAREVMGAGEELILGLPLSTRGGGWVGVVNIEQPVLFFHFFLVVLGLGNGLIHRLEYFG